MNRKQGTKTIGGPKKNLIFRKKLDSCGQLFPCHTCMKQMFLPCE